MTLPQALAEHARTRPGHPALTFVSHARDPDGTRQTLTYAELDTRARTLAVALSAKFPAGSRVALLCPQSVEYAVAFLGVLYAGMTAVPLHAPDEVRRTGRLAAVLADAAPACVLTASALPRDLACAPVLDVTETGASQAAPLPAPDPAAPAYLQYTSGSTGTPAGAVVTHGNLTAAAEQCVAGYGCSPDTPFASWLPLFHDMGLALGLFVPLLTGAHTALMTPTAFVQRPERWLRLLDRHRAYVSGAPDFAYDLCVRRAATATGLDLSGVGVLINGAEPVRARTMRAFSAAFAPAGLAPHTVRPSYGLAEATVMVSCVRPDGTWRELRLDAGELEAGRVRIAEPEARALEAVGCGSPVGQEVRVTDPETGRPRPAGRVGELQVRGPNVCDGYFRGRLPCVRDGWLRTGDLGFLYEGEVFVLGRLKDVVIVNGANHAPADIEDTVQSALPEAVPHGVAVFDATGPDGGQRLVVAVEVTGVREPGLAPRVRQAVADHHGVRVHDVLPVRRGALPRTTSGKIRRGACRERYEKNGDLS